MAARNEGETWIERTAARKGRFRSVGGSDKNRPWRASIRRWHGGVSGIAVRERSLAPSFPYRSSSRELRGDVTLLCIRVTWPRCCRGPCVLRCVASARIFLVSRVFVPLLGNIGSFRRYRRIAAVTDRDTSRARIRAYITERCTDLSNEMTFDPLEAVVQHGNGVLAGNGGWIERQSYLCGQWTERSDNVTRSLYICSTPLPVIVSGCSSSVSCVCILVRLWSA